MPYEPPKYPGAIPTAEDLPDRVDDVDWLYAARYNELKKELRAALIELGTDPSGASATIKDRLTLLALKTNVLELDNTTPFTPDADHEPATKKYVDDAIPPGFVDRGDPVGFDFAVGDFITDGTWRDLDLSGIVPAGAKAVSLKVYVEDNLVGQSFLLRENGNTNPYNAPIILTQIANVPCGADLIVVCDSNRVVEYFASNTTWTALFLVVKCWWK